MIISPTPLASKTSLSVADLAENLRKVAEVVGGGAYNGTAPVSYVGGISRDNLAPGLRIPNSLKSEPYSIVVVQVPMRQYGFGGMDAVILPATFGLASAQLVGGSFAYSYITGGATAMSTSLVVNVGTAAPFGASITVTSLAPVTALTFAPSPNPYTFTSAAMTRIEVRYGAAITPVGGAGTREVFGAQVCLTFKVKHVA